MFNIQIEKVYKIKPQNIQFQTQISGLVLPLQHLHPSPIMVAKEAAMIVSKQQLQLITERLRPVATAMLFVTAEATFLFPSSKTRRSPSAPV